MPVHSKPLNLSVHVCLETRDTLHAKRVRDSLAGVVSLIDRWLIEGFAPPIGCFASVPPAPLSAETPGDRAGAGLETDQSSDRECEREARRYLQLSDEERRVWLIARLLSELGNRP